MIVEKRGLVYVGKRYCELMMFLEEKNVMFYEISQKMEIEIDLNDTNKNNVLSLLFINDFIDIEEKLKANEIDKLVLWR